MALESLSSSILYVSLSCFACTSSRVAWIIAFLVFCLRRSQADGFTGLDVTTLRAIYLS